MMPRKTVQFMSFIIFVAYTVSASANQDGRSDHLKTFEGDNVKCKGASCFQRRENKSKREAGIPNKDIPQKCDRILVENTGELTSPNWPKKQVDYTICRIAIILEHSQRPLLIFEQFELEGSGPEHDCQDDKLENYVLIQDTVTLRQERLCGSKSNFTWSADSNEVIVLFVAHSSTIFHRFKASYSGVTRHPPSDCSETLTSEAGRYASFTPEELAALNSSLTFLQCKVLFHASAGDRLLLTFDSVSTSCETPVMIQDVLTGREAEFCSNLSSFSWLSDGNEVMMSFSQDVNSPSAVQVVMEYETIVPPARLSQECSTKLFAPKDGSQGHISSPQYPNPYPSNMNCETFISADPSMMVVLTFGVFHLEPSAHPVEKDLSEVLPMLDKAMEDGLEQEDCVFDYVQIQDLSTDRVDRFCGVRHPFSWTSDSNVVLVQFRTDSMLSFAGFNANFYAMDRLPDPDCVSMVVDSPSAALLTSTLYPLPYPANVDCTLLIHQHPDQFVTLDFMIFDLETSEDCGSDVLKITDVTSLRSESFCGSLAPFSWSSDSNEILIQFKTDNKIQAGGFSVIGAAAVLPSKAVVGSSKLGLLSVLTLTDLWLTKTHSRKSENCN